MRVEKVDKNYFKDLQKKYKNKGKGLPFVGFNPNVELNNKAFNQALRNENPTEPLISNSTEGDSNAAQATNQVSSSTAGSVGEAWEYKNTSAAKYVYEGPSYILDEYKMRLDEKGKYETIAKSDKEAIRNIKYQIAKKHGYPKNASIVIDRKLVRKPLDMYSGDYSEYDIDYENRMNGDYNFYDPDRTDDYMVGDTLIRGSRTVHEALYALDEITRGENK